MSGQQSLVGVRPYGETRDARQRRSDMVSRSGRVLEDVAAPALDYSRGISSYQPAGQSRIAPRVYTTVAKPLVPQKRAQDLGGASPAPIGVKVGLCPFGPFLPTEADTDATPAPVVYRASDLMRALCRVCECTRADVTGPRRTAHIVKARQIGFWIFRRFSGRSLPAIGAAFGGRDHSTALWGAHRGDHTIAELGIEVSDDPVEMMRRLHAVTWPRLTKEPAPLRIERRP